MEQTDQTVSFLTCLFTQEPLRLLNETELGVVNEKIANNELCFFEGSPCYQPLKKAYSTNQYLHIYPEIDGILYLKKASTVVSKNRVEFPLHRRDKTENDLFYRSLGFVEDTSTLNNKKVIRLSNQELKDFKSRLRKKVDLLFTSNAASVDDILNLTYGMNIKSHIHADHDLVRLRAIQTNIPQHVTSILIDQDHIPVSSDQIDSFVNFEPIDLMEKERQLSFYHLLKSVLTFNGIMVSAYDLRSNLYLEKQLLSDIRKKNALSFITPWKKSFLPKMYFIEVGQSYESFMSNSGHLKRSLTKQLG